MAEELRFRRTFGLAIDEANDEKRTVPLAFSSEQPVERNIRGKRVKEVLDHSGDSVDLSRLNDGAPLLVNHDERNQCGVVDGAKVDVDKRGRAVVRFSRSAYGEEIFNDVKDGIRRKVSVAYEILDGQVEESRNKGELDTFRVTRWLPYEVSLVAIPADSTVGVGRSASEPSPAPPNQPKEKQHTVENTPTATPPAAPSQIDVQAERSRGKQEEAQRRNEIEAIAANLKRQKIDVSEAAQSFIRDGKGADEFKDHVLRNEFKAVPVTPDETKLDVPEKDIRKFSLLRAVNDFATTGRLSGLEAEISAEAQKRSDRKPAGFLVPNEVLALQGQRDLTVGTATAGGNLVATELQSQSFVELLRNRMVVRQLGARSLGGLTGNVAIPRQTGGATAYWVSETGAVTESAQTIDQIAMTPKGVSALTDFSKLLTIQSSLDVENFARQDIAKVLALAIDSAAISGTGSSNQPTGITATSGIGSVALGTNGGAPTWAMVVGLETAVANSNADYGTLGYLTNTKVRGKLKQTPKQASGVEGNFIWPDLPFPGSPGMGMLNGYKAAVSNQVSSTLTKGTAENVASAMVFGNFDDLVIAEWNGVDVVVDPYTQAANRVIRLVVSMWVDIAVRHPASFAACLDILTT